MRRTLGFVTMLMLAASPALAQKVTIDYAKDFDFSAVKTFQYVSTAETADADSLMDERIRKSIAAKLTAGGLQQVEAEPDIFVTYHVTTKQDQVFTTTGFGYSGWGAGWGGWGPGMSASTTTSTTYTVGTLIIDAYDATEKKTVWRGTGTVTVKSNPEKRAQQVDKVLDKLGARWQKILKGMGE